MKKKEKKPAKIVVQPENIDSELRALDQWVTWQWVRKPNGWQKVPIGKSNDAATWGSFEQKYAEYLEHKRSGVGFVFREDGDYIGVDIDSCRDPETGKLTDIAQEIVDDLNTYCEVSPSATGVKMWLRGKFDGKAFRKQYRTDELEIEIYQDGRFFTCTGNIHGQALPIAQAGERFNRVLVHYLRNEFQDVKRSADPKRDQDLAKLALDHVDPICCYKVWLDIGMALRSLGNDMFDVWDSWSQKAGDPAYPGRDELAKKWKTFPAEGKIKIGTLFFYAQQNGFKVPAVGYEVSDYGVAKRVRDSAAGKLYYVPEWQKWIAWSGQQFQTDYENHFVEAVVDVSKQIAAEIPRPAADAGKEELENYQANQRFAKKYQSKGGIYAVEALCRGLMVKPHRELDKDPTLFACQNGIIALDAIKHLPHDPKYLHTIKSDVAYNPEAKCPRWLQFIDEITTGNKSLADYLQRLCGYCLSGKIEGESLFILYGGGSNGKSIFTRILLKVLGDYGGTVRQELLMASPNQHPTQFAYLYGRRCVVAQETDQDCRLNENQVKALTGGDRIQCRRMREDFWEFEPTHKIWLATNHLPSVRGTDNGIWRRVKLIPFEARFEGEAVDTTLYDKLVAELSGILNWALEGYALYLFDGLGEPDVVKNARDAYRQEMSAVSQFVQDECELGETKEIRADKLYQAFRFYCEQYGHFVSSARKFAFDLDAIGVKTARKNDGRYKIGVDLKPDFTPL